RVDHLHVDLARLLDGLEDRLLGDLVEHQTADFLFRRAELLGEVPADGFAFAVGVGRDVDLVGRLRRVFQLLDDLDAVGNDDVLRLAPGVDVHTQLALRQIPDVADRRNDFEVPTQILADRLRLRGRLDDDERLGHETPLNVPSININSRSVKPDVST